MLQSMACYKGNHCRAFAWRKCMSAWAVCSDGNVRIAHLHMAPQQPVMQTSPSLHGAHADLLSRHLKARRWLPW